MKRIGSLLLLAALVFTAGCTFSGKPVPTEEPAQNTPGPVVTMAPREEAADPEFIAMTLDSMVFGEDYMALYDVFGEGVFVNEVFAGENGLAYIERDGVKYELGLDFLSRAMVLNAEPAGEFDTKEKAAAEWFRWLMLRWNYLLPEIPVYSTEYWSVFSSDIKGVDEHPVNPYEGTERALVYWRSMKEDGSITIGVQGEILGNFLCPEFPLAAYYASDADAAVGRLVNGLELVSETREGGLVYNDTVVKEHEETRNEDGSMTFSITLWDDLYFSDGSPVTAKDYLAGIAAVSTPVFREAFPGAPLYGTDLIDREDPFFDYEGEGEGGVLRTLRMTDEHSFSITVPKEKTEGYYSFSVLRIPAESAAVWLCGAELRDDGEGCYITKDFYERNGEGFRNAERLMNILTGTSGETEDIPRSGPYRVVWLGQDPDDPTEEPSNMAVLEKNEYFKGNHEGVKPSANRVRVRKELSATRLNDLAEGRLDFVTGLCGEAEVLEIERLAESSEGRFGLAHYTRAGCGRLLFRGDLGPVQFASVRRALALCIDCEGYAGELGGGTGTVYGPVHEDLWLYRLAKERGLEFDPYEPDLERAVAELEKGGWIYDEKGDPYVSGVRWKRIPADVIDEKDVGFKSVDGEYSVVKVGEYYYMPLVINMFTPASSSFSAEIYLIYDNELLGKAGICVQVTNGGFAQMMNEFFQAEVYGFWLGEEIVPTYDLFMIGASWADPVYDLSGKFTIDPELYNNTSGFYLRDHADVYMP